MSDDAINTTSRDKDPPDCPVLGRATISVLMRVKGASPDLALDLISRVHCACRLTSVDLCGLAVVRERAIRRECNNDEKDVAEMTQQFIRSYGCT